MEVAPGIYDVSKAGEGAIALTCLIGCPSIDKSIQIEATPYDHGEPLDATLVMSFEEGDDDLHIAILSADGSGLIARGSHSGVTTRAAIQLNTSLYYQRIKLCRASTEPWRAGC